MIIELGKVSLDTLGRPDLDRRENFPACDADAVVQQPQCPRT